MSPSRQHDAPHCPLEGCRLAAEIVRIDSLEKWQDKQNGTLQRLEDKIDKVQWWLMGSLFTALLALVGILATLLREAKP